MLNSELKCTYKNRLQRVRYTSVLSSLCICSWSECVVVRTVSWIELFHWAVVVGLFDSCTWIDFKYMQSILWRCACKKDPTFIRTSVPYHMWCILQNPYMFTEQINSFFYCLNGLDLREEKKVSIKFFRFDLKSFQFFFFFSNSVPSSYYSCSSCLIAVVLLVSNFSTSMCKYLHTKRPLFILSTNEFMRVLIWSSFQLN